jgi:hypothetical protein
MTNHQKSIKEDSVPANATGPAVSGTGDSGITWGDTPKQKKKLRSIIARKEVWKNGRL